MKRKEPKTTTDELTRMVAKGFADTQQYMDKRFDAIDVRFDRIEAESKMQGGRLDRIERELSEIKQKLDRIDKRTNEDDLAMFSDIDWLRKKVLHLEKEIKILKTKQSRS